MGWNWAFYPDFEADDLAGLICRGIDPAWEITLATPDTDWHQAPCEIREAIVMEPIDGRRNAGPGILLTWCV